MTGNIAIRTGKATDPESNAGQEPLKGERGRTRELKLLCSFCNPQKQILSKQMQLKCIWLGEGMPNTDV